MRENHQKQMPLLEPTSGHSQEKELEAISNIIDSTPTICERVLQELNRGKIFKRRTGARGMSADQVLRAAIVMNLFGFTYKELAFHISDSRALRTFCRVGFAGKGFKKSALNANIKSLSPDTWYAILKDIVGYAKDEKIESGRKVRIDCTVVESNIHKPFDSHQLWDCVRVLTALLICACGVFGAKIHFSDHRRRAKKRMIGILYGKSKKDRKTKYMDLLKVTRMALGYAAAALPVLEQMQTADIRILSLIQAIEHYMALTKRVIDQTERRVINGESVAAQDKVVSIFEEHTDIIIKDNRDTHYGHKICLTGGASNLILDCVILEGNPADSTLVEQMLDRQNDIYGRYPLKISLDGGFASKDNLTAAKSRKIKDVCFSKGRGLEETDMCRSEYVYKKLRRFRAGIESGISWLKRSFGLTRCTWKGFESFKSYVLSSIIAANLLTLARKKLATA